MRKPSKEIERRGRKQGWVSSLWCRYEQNPEREKRKRSEMKKKQNEKNRQQRGKQEMGVELNYEV